MCRASLLIAAYRKLYGQFRDKHTGRWQIKEILSRGATPATLVKKGGR
jgi:hypothetical protein